MGWSRWRVAVVILGLLGLAASLAILGAVFRTSDLSTTADVAQLLSMLVTTVTPGVGLIVWLRRPARVPVSSTPNVAEAEKMLAELIAQQWKAEAALRSLDDPYPMPVQWQLTTREEVVHRLAKPAVGALRRVGSSADVRKLTLGFRRLRRRRVVILGEPGSGKTTLAVQLLRELVSSRQPGEPIPVLLSVADWDTEVFPRLHDWLAVRLRRDYPALRAPGLGDHAPHALAARGRVLPVLDGLDELPDAARGAVISALNRSLGDDDQLILTSRSDEYADAVALASCTINSAVVIESLPLAPRVGAEYLQYCLLPEPVAAWDHVLRCLRDPANQGTVLTELTSTALGLWLLRAVYVSPGVDPSPLLDEDRFSSVAALRAHLFDRLIPAIIETRPPSSARNDPFRPSRRLDPDQVTDWLSYLAGHLARTPVGEERVGTRDFAWWHLARHTFRQRSFSVVVGLLFGFAFGFSYWLADEIVFGFELALTSWLMVGLLGGIVAARSGKTWIEDSPGFADLRVTGRIAPLFRLARQNTAILGRIVVVAGVAFALPVWVTFWVVAWPESTSALGPIERGIVGLASVGFWIITGLSLGFARGFAEWIEMPTPAGRASSPWANWKADRDLNLARSAAGGIVLALVGLSMWLIFVLPAWLPQWLIYGHVANLATLLPAWFLAGAAGGLASGKHHAWIAYALAAHRLARKRVLPRRLLPFLDDAHRLGLLRTVGPIYQFRHAEFQDHLAEAYRRRFASPHKDGL